MSYVSIDLYFDGDFLVMDQESFLEKSFNKLIEKKVFNKEDMFHMNSLKAESFNHLFLFEPDDTKNPLLSKQELSLLRIGVNTISFYALSIGSHVQSALGQVARGQAAGRRRHLDALRMLCYYVFHTKNLVLRLECPPWVDQRFSLKKLNIFMECYFDSSLGSSSALGTDAHARQGCIINVGVLKDKMAPVSAKSSLQTTVSLSTCEAELTACSWSAKQLIGLFNLLSEIFQGSTMNTPAMYGDNRAANLLASNQASVRNHRHLQLPQLWVRNLTRANLIRIYQVDTHLNISDLLTKVLPHQKLESLMKLMGYVVSKS